MTGGGGGGGGERDKGGGGRVSRSWEIILGHLLAQIFFNKNLPEYRFLKGLKIFPINNSKKDLATPPSVYSLWAGACGNRLRDS